MPYTKNTIRVKVPQRSGFDKSHRNSGTSFCGTLTPLLCDELIPNSRCSLKIPISVQLPPLASDTFMNVQYRVEAFFVPMRLLCKSFEDFFCDFPKRVYSNVSGGATKNGTFSDVKGRLPVFTLTDGDMNILEPCSLLDYLGIKAAMSATGTFDINPLPIAAYHLVWQEFYRNPRVQNPAFAENVGSILLGTALTQRRVVSMPYTFYHDAFTGSGGTVPSNIIHTVSSSNLDNYNLADGVNFFSLRQRNFGLDYFTGSRVSPQQGDAVSVTMLVPTTGLPVADGEVLNDTDATFTIAQLRAANSLQQWRERNNIPSPRLVDQVKARYNANLSDGVAQRPICIGSASFDVSTFGVNQTSDNTGSSANPFNSVANEYGRANARGNEFVINDFVANEPGYLLVLGSLVPEVSYSSGVSRMFTRYLGAGSITDMACSLLQNVGDQPIYLYELAATLGDSSEDKKIFSYQDRFSDFMFIPNQIHGLFRDNNS